MKVNEIFLSVQGEGTRVGLPCVFIRLSGCNFRCSYCDTKYAYEEGKEMSVEEVYREVVKYGCGLIEITGGEPLLQKEEIEKLIKYIRKYNTHFKGIIDILIETNGSVKIPTGFYERIKKEEDYVNVYIIADYKLPSSGMENFEQAMKVINNLLPGDEVKFVIGDRKDYERSREIVLGYNLHNASQVLFSPVFGKIQPSEIVKWMLEDKLYKVRFQLQLHKIIWEPSKRGV